MLKNITMISASAGSGKTYTLTEKLAKAIQDGVQPEHVAAITFTKKAAQELGGRVRSKLLEAGDFDSAGRILDGYIGTINSVCGQILKEHSFEAGLPPVLEVLPEGEDQLVFQRALAPATDRFSLQLNSLAGTLGINDWESIVRDIINVARANGIPPKGMLNCGEKSWNSFKLLLPLALSVDQGIQLEKEFLAEINTTLSRIPVEGDTTAGTRKGREALLKISRLIRNQSLPEWSEWLRAGRLTVCKKSESHVVKMRALGLRCIEHPRFHTDIKSFIETLFECAAAAMDLYARHKAEQGLIDFTDQEALTLELMKSKDTAGRIGESLGILMVDEFQDTSPIQLALFLKLTEAAGKGIWVGDQKQAIYGFRGTDPQLMDEVLAGAGQVVPLENSWRSQPALVDFCSEFFAQAFSSQNISEKRVRLTSKVTSTDSPSPHLKCMLFDSTNQQNDAKAVATGIKALLQEADQHVILDKIDKTPRPLRLGDIAVLCSTNPECREVAEALEKNSIQAAIPETGLMARPEAVLVTAAFRYLLDDRDNLAAAELARLLPENKGAKDWLKQCILHEKGGEHLKSMLPLLGKLDRARNEITMLTPSEMLDMCIRLIDAERIVSSWKDGTKRLNNLDALRGFAATYEETCKSRRCACTPTGMLNHFLELAKNEQDSQAGTPGNDAVHVVTYHSSKGLEWPVVIMTSLKKHRVSKAFGVHVEGAEGGFDPNAPLANRWIRYWPWPFGGLSKAPGEFLDEIDECPETARVRDASEKENLRLLYVGMTRARDHLILTKRTGDCAEWVEGCLDDDGNEIFTLPDKPGIQTVKIKGKSFPIDVRLYGPEEPEELCRTEGTFMHPVPDERPEYPPKFFSPSAVKEIPEGTQAETFQIGEPFDIKRTSNPVLLGDAVHAFFASLPPNADDHGCKKHANTILSDWDIQDVDAGRLAEASHNLRAFLKGHCPDGTVHTEWPIFLRRGNQIGSGWIDMLIRTEQGDLIIDHKTTIAPQKRAVKKALEYAGQQAIYREALLRAGRPVLGTWIHFPLMGMMVELKFEDIQSQ